ncbi:MAG: hypothetical protein HUJ65_03265, partial [Oscillospiraceae bacterium]|nr:hypothetical protein [Oscillospiraceae bacterium]
MKKIRISDITLRESDQLYTAGLSFKEKIEIAKNLERLRVDVIELGRLTEKPADSALLRTLSAPITESALCVPVTLNKEEIDRAWDSLSKAPKARMNITAPASTVQMEYLYHTKPKKVLELITELVAYAVTLCPEIEFTAEDATRSEKE